MSTVSGFLAQLVSPPEVNCDSHILVAVEQPVLEKAPKRRRSAGSTAGGESQKATRAASKRVVKKQEAAPPTSSIDCASDDEFEQERALPNRMLSRLADQDDDDDDDEDMLEEGILGHGTLNENEDDPIEDSLTQAPHPPKQSAVKPSVSPEHGIDLACPADGSDDCSLASAGLARRTARRGDGARSLVAWLVAHGLWRMRCRILLSIHTPRREVAHGSPISCERDLVEIGKREKRTYAASVSVLFDRALSQPLRTSQPRSPRVLMQV